MRHKGFVLFPLLIILALFLVIGLIIYKKIPGNVAPPTSQKADTSVNKTKTTESEVKDWNTYYNEQYSFQISYPPNWKQIVHSANSEDTIEFGLEDDPDDNILIRYYKDIDIFKNASVETVAEREIVDSGFTFTTIRINKGQYDTSETKINSDPVKIMYTIKHPTKNVFVLIWFSDKNTQKDKLLSTFKFVE